LRFAHPTAAADVPSHRLQITATFTFRQPPTAFTLPTSIRTSFTSARANESQADANAAMRWAARVRTPSRPRWWSAG